ncbi:MAG: ATP-dependent sacrificial sulfur transferase LarE [Desulfatiglandaceae bacterium]
MDERTARAKKAALLSRLKGMGDLVVAFSGGVDSTFLLAAAKEALGSNVIAATACSFVYSETETREASRIAEILGVHQILFQSLETAQEPFIANDKDRCYYCKKSVLGEIFRIAREHGMENVAHGANWDDQGDYRPGFRAAEELGAFAPLMEVELTKDEIRFLSREMDLPTWDKPSMACLASRIPYGTPVTPERAGMVEKAERFLAEKGFRVARVRHHGTVARLELVLEDLTRILDGGLRKQVVDVFKTIGFQHVALDMEGYVTGKMNRSLEAAKGKTV